jgi:hypothetical protein
MIFPQGISIVILSSGSHNPIVTERSCVSLEPTWT